MNQFSITRDPLVQANMAFFDVTKILRSRAKETPDQLLFTYLSDGEYEAESLTAAALDRRCRRLAAYLQLHNLVGRRLLLAYPAGLEFVVGFFGCLYAHAIAVPAYPPRGNRHDERLDAIARDADVAAVLTTEKIAKSGPSHSRAGGLSQLSWIATDQPLAASPEDWQPPELVPHDLAYLQYTSGSSGVPKGVMVSHGNIYENSRAIQPACTMTLSSEPCAVTWLPNFHDMGLCDGIIQPVYSGYRCYLMAPQAFVWRPVRWLQAISRYRATHSGAPDFGYRLCVERVSPEERDALDLSCWVNAYTGAEPVRVDTLRRFAEYFGPAGFRSQSYFPTYGMAETTLMISGGPMHDAPTSLELDASALERHKVVQVAAGTAGSRTVVGCGPPCFNTDVAIVNQQTGARCRPDEIGEIWVAGGGVTQGYWKRPEETATAFNAFIAGSGEGPFLRTGDLGFMHDGELYITGRCKDLVIIRGRNHYPQDIEQTAERSHPALGQSVAAFSVEEDGQEGLVLVHEVKRDWLRKFPLAEVVAAICAAVTTEHDIAVRALCFVKPARLPTTSSGKIQRSNAKAAWLAEELDPIATWTRPKTNIESPAGGSASEATDNPIPLAGSREIERWLRHLLGQRLEIAPASIDAEAPLAQYGMDSVAAVEMAAALQSRLGARFPPTVFYDYPTIEALAAFLAGSGPGRQPSRAPIPGGVSSVEPIVIVGMGCRFPAARSPNEFWRLLETGGDAITPFPASRENAHLFDPDTLPPQCARVARGGFLDTVESFDAQFFGIAPREAENIDPQQRLLLEVAWEALEDAGLDVDRLTGTDAGVFIGISNYDYGRLVMSNGGAPDPWSGTGNALSIAANRLSYFFDLRGPSLSIDTACSSSLVAVHQACESLRHGQCQLALAGGVNLILGPQLSQAFVAAGMLSPDGLCKTFDASADGYVRGEGCGIVVLKRLSDAERDGDRIWAVIRGSAVNQDGRSNGLTAPNGPSQQAVIEQALKVAGVEPAEIGLVEAHGTGTPLGDPIELNTLSTLLSPGRTATTPCWIGSVKTNIGHLESAAGIAGLMKAVLALHHARIPAHLNCKILNPLIQLDPACLRIPGEIVAWPNGTGTRLAGVSSFGFGGTNAHVVLSESPAAIATRSDMPSQSGGARQPGPDLERPLHVLNLSAKSVPALREAAAQMVEHLQAHPDLPLADVCFSAATGRSHLTHRLSVIGESSEDAIRPLSQFAAGLPAEPRTTGQVRADSAPRIAFLMTGQGAQYTGMGRALYNTEPLFRATLDRCAELLATALDRPLLDVMFATGEASRSRLNDTAYTQPALFALEYALAKLWQAWGIRPDYVLGHSVGEYVAACLAGVFSLEDGLKLVAERGRLLQSLPRSGGMLVVAADEATVADEIRAWPDDLSLAAINGPRSTVVSGRTTALARIAKIFADRGVKTTELTVSHAFHSPLVEPILDEFLDAARAISFSSPVVPMVSNVTGELATGAIATATYWRQHVRAPVRFEQGIRTLRGLDVSTFLEIGPQPTLLAMGQTCLSDTGMLWLPSLREGRQDWRIMLESLRALYLCGARPDWRTYDRGYERKKVFLPPYPFQRQRHWLKAAPDHQADERPAPGMHPLLGRRVATPLADILFQARLSTAEPGYLRDHRVFGKILLPAAAFLEIGLAAVRSLSRAKPMRLQDVAIHQPLELHDEQVLIHTVLTPDRSEWNWRVFSHNEAANSDEETAGNAWTLHLSGHLAATEAEGTLPHNLSAKQALIVDQIRADSLYDTCAEHGLDYGPKFRAIRQIWRCEQEALAHLHLPDGLTTQPYQLHPVLIDACFVSIVAAIGPAPRCTYIPVGIERVSFHGDWAATSQVRAGWAHVRVQQQNETDSETITADATLWSEDGQPLAEFHRLKFKQVGPTQLADKDAAPIAEWLYEIQWRSAGLSSGTRLLGLDFLPATSVIARPVVRYLQDAVSGPAMRRYGEGLARLDHLGIEFVIDAFRRLGWDFEERRWFSRDELHNRLRIADKHRRLLARLLELLDEGGVLARRGQEFCTRHAPAAPDLNGHVARLRAEHPEIKVELDLLARCAGALYKMLRTDYDPLELLFPQGDLTSAAQLYHATPGSQVLNEAVRRSVTDMIASMPWWRGIRILEIGGGTGGTTASLLPHLPNDRCDYWFTDISAMFIDQARQKFCAFDFIHYRTLDIEREPGEQGLADVHFDIVIAGNVLHAASDVRRALRHTRLLLAPGGAVVLLEGTHPVGWIDLIFGLTKQWWGFTDGELRTRHPLLSASGWRDVLQESGFPDVAVASADAAQVLAHQAVIIARTEPIATRAAMAQSRHAKQWLVFTDQSNAARQLIEGLIEHSRSCIVVAADDSLRDPVAGDLAVSGSPQYWLNPHDPAHYQRLLNSIGGVEMPVDGVVYFWGSVAPPSASDVAVRSGINSCLHAVKAFVAAGLVAPPAFWIITRDACAVGPDSIVSGLWQSPISGFAQAVALEHPELQLRQIDLGADWADEDGDALIAEVWSPGAERLVSLHSRRRQVARLARIENIVGRDPDAIAIPHARGFRLAISERGSLDNLVVDQFRQQPPGPGQVQIEVAFAGLNFRDVLNALGLYRGDAGALGGECAGKVTAVGDGVQTLRPGDQVLAIAPAAFADYVTTDARLVVAVPPSCTLAEAATIPIAFATAWYTLLDLAGLRRGERVLIHAASGGVGQAAIQIARHVGAEVFCTAGSQKRAVLEALGVEHIFDSRKLDFPEQIYHLTRGEGVDVVLNSLTGTGAPKSFEVLRGGGRFIDISKGEFREPASADQEHRDITYHGFDLAEVCRTDPQAIQQLLSKIVGELASRALQPLSARTFDLANARAAFRWMQQSRHTGKIIVRIPSPSPGAPAGSTQSAAAIRLQPNATYLISGGFGALGLLTARWMTARGARSLVLLGRSEPDERAQSQIAELEAAGAQVRIVQADVADAGQLRQALEEVRQSLLPLRGVIHSAGQLDDGVVTQQTPERFGRVMAAKVAGSWNLHLLTQGDTLDFFVMYSSAASVLGSAGQANHSAANAFLDALAHFRRAAGLPSLCINWGPWLDIGEASKREAGKRFDTKGMGAIAPEQGLRILERLWDGSRTQVAVLPINWPQLLDHYPDHELLSDFRGAAGQRANSSSLRSLLAQTAEHDRPATVAAFIAEQVASALGLASAADVDHETGFFDLGMDSLTSVELRNRLQAELGCQLPTTSIFDFPNVEALTRFVVREVLQLDVPEPPSSRPAEIARRAEENVDALDQLSDEELAELLGKKLTLMT
ncbi:MAG TPA: SDR family NAD(P)-dependent oxidoreductase [Acetobacteraceae bacterium]|nr:SDR family NAD(P)-dependent oxidoreductase [Acetobacteraceae bacterium]